MAPKEESTSKQETSKDTSKSSKEELNPATTVDVIFKVWAPNFDRGTHQLYLLGSTKQLGSWKIDHATVAYPTKDEHTWRVEIRGFPMNSSFDWSWVTTLHDKTNLVWENPRRRNRKLGSVGGVIHTIFGDSEEVFVKTSTFVHASTYRKVEPGHYMVLTGNAPTTGHWELNKAVVASENPRNSGYWSCQFTFDANNCLTFKWAILKEDDGSLHLMEKESHKLYGRTSWIRVVAPWNVDRVFVEDCPIRTDRTDEFTGRTDILVNNKRKKQYAIRAWLRKGGNSKSKEPIFPISQVKPPPPEDLPTPKKTPTVTNQDKARKALMAIAYKHPVPIVQSEEPSTAIIPVENKGKKSKAEQQKGAAGKSDQKKNPPKKSAPELPVSAPPLKDPADSNDPLLEMMLEQPLVEPTVLGLIHLVPPYSERKQVMQRQRTDEEEKLSMKEMNKKYSAISLVVKGNNAGKRKSAKVATIGDPVDFFLNKLEKLSNVFENFAQSASDDLKPLPKSSSAHLTRDLSLKNFETYPPPDWSLMQEIERFNMNKFLTKGKKEAKQLSLPSSKESSVHDQPEKTRKAVTSDNFRPRITVTDKGTPFVKSHGTGKEPSVVGKDDLMKSPSDVRLEIKNRESWEIKGDTVYGAKKLPAKKSTAPYTKQQ